MTLEAGYNLNYDVATKVMDWSVELIVNPVGTNFEEWRDSQGWRYGSTPPPFSTEIEWAWKVVEHMHGMGHHLMLWFDDVSGTHPQWGARFPRLLTGRHETHEADTAPLAICLAALAAVAS